MPAEKTITIIGAGLSGLTLAYLLRDSEYEVQVLESRERLGGRIFTSISSDGTPLEMGATWFGSKHLNFSWLLNELGVETKEQDLGDQAHYESISTSPPMLVDLPPSADPTFKLKTGTGQDIWMGPFPARWVLRLAYWRNS